MYQIPNDTVLTTKIGLLGSLREYEGVSNKISRGQGPRPRVVSVKTPACQRGHHALRL